MRSIKDEQSELVIEADAEHVDLRHGVGVRAIGDLVVLPLPAHADASGELVAQPDAGLPAPPVLACTGGEDIDGAGAGKVHFRFRFLNANASEHAEALTNGIAEHGVDVEALRLRFPVKSTGRIDGGVELELPEIEVPSFERKVLVEAVADECLVRSAGLVLTGSGRAREAGR